MTVFYSIVQIKFDTYIQLNITKYTNIFTSEENALTYAKAKASPHTLLCIQKDECIIENLIYNNISYFENEIFNNNIKYEVIFKNNMRVL